MSGRRMWVLYGSNIKPRKRKLETWGLRDALICHNLFCLVRNSQELKKKKKVDNKNSPRRSLKFTHFRETNKKSCQISCHGCKSELSELMVLSRGALYRGYISRLLFWWPHRKSLTIKAVFQADPEYSTHLFSSHGPWLDEMIFSRCSVAVMQGFLLVSMESTLELMQWFS